MNKPIDLTPMKAALAEWRRLKEKVGELPSWDIEVDKKDSDFIWVGPERGRARIMIDIQDTDTSIPDFVAHAHNTPIENMLEILIEEVERLRDNHDRITRRSADPTGTLS